MRKLTPWIPPEVPYSFPTHDFPPLFDKTYTDAVAWAIQIQWRVNHPEDMKLVEAQGFREGKDIEWYAAAILRHWNLIGILSAGGIPQRDGGRDPVVFGGRVQTMKSLKKELDRLIRKAEVLVSPPNLKAQNAGKVRGKQQTTSRKKEWERWQKEADDIWHKYPTWGIERVAKKIQKMFPDETVSTIRLRIKKPSL